jgi:hypothetical protein
MPTRATYLAATVNGSAVVQIMSARCSFGYDQQVSEAVIYVPRAPTQNIGTWAASHAYGAGAVVRPTSRNGHTYVAAVGGTSGGSQPTWPTTPGATVVNGGVTWEEGGVDAVYDDAIVLAMGAGTNNFARFVGVLRRFDFTLAPRMVGLVCFGPLVRAQQYENNQEGSGSPGGLDLIDLLGAGSGTDQAIVQAVLGRVPGLSFTSGNIGGTGVTFGAQVTTLSPSPFLWRNGQNPSIRLDVGGKGETALEYIARIDAVSAVYTDSTSPAGFYRTYEQVDGTIRRALLGSRPRGTADFTFTEGTDIWQGSSSREYPTANRVYVQGYDYAGASGHGMGPVSNLLSSTIQSSNPYMPSTEQHTFTFSSPLLERGLDAEAGTGMSCETVANALMLDVNRETVRADFTTPRDDVIGPGATVLVQAAGGLPDRLGIGENLWVTHVDISVDEDGAFSQRLQCLGGGLPDNYTSAPPV